MSGKGRKHKRGDRGSLEEEPTESKRANMAASEGENEGTSTGKPLEITEEPSLSELRGMLVDIQTTVNNILLENKRICNEVSELKATVRKQQSEIIAVKDALAQARKQSAETEKELSAARKHLDEHEEELQELYDLQDHLEQYTRKNSLEFHGVPESAYISTEEAVIKIANAIDVPVVAEDIEISHKLNKRGSKAIIAKFLNHKVKSSLYRARVKLKNITLSDLFPGATYASAAQSNRIFINENLTSYRRKIMSRANEKRRDGELLSVWSLDGRIFVKTSPDGRPIKISDLEDLDYL